MATTDRGAFAGMVVDHLRLHVADAGAAARRLSRGYGLAVAATGGPEADVRSVALARDRIRLVLDRPAAGDRSARSFLARHGEGVADIALGVQDAAAAFHEAVGRGARPVSPPAAGGGVVTATVEGFADVTHTFVQRSRGVAPGALPGLAPVAGPPPAEDTGLVAIDHLAVCVPPGAIGPLAAFYRRVFDFETTFTERIVVGAQAVVTCAVQSGSGAVTLTLIEPDPDREPGQIDRFLRDHGGPGVQHIAFATPDIVAAVASLGRAGVRFLQAPAAYYTALPRRLEPVRHSVAELAAHHVLVDVDHGGQLFQIFTESTHPRNTLFFEIIERQGALTFGGGNITALYESVRLQAGRVPGPG
ncbi:4-hydroxyphenylpyruvate dioxygenase [Streptomyces sp. SBT349]|uniref:4-hydroxyphenylpyruvate dioxygenase n=1 Tax=Streptomyces sp. SBT349 TaxID=1580539 RepID=UPI00066B7578|nr:4-hydroxyphenylpyruvate dioxygenase [Streptomyces sp. SBT349]